MDRHEWSDIVGSWRTPVAAVGRVAVVMVVLAAPAWAQPDWRDSHAQRDPGSPTFQPVDPVAKSLQQTEAMRERFGAREQRFQADPNRRQWRPRQPQPGEVDIPGREEAPSVRDPLRGTLRSILPHDR